MVVPIRLFLLGLTATFGPCLLCLPILLPYLAATRRRVKEGLISAIVFSISRIFTFGLLGLLAGVGGELLLGSLSKFSSGIHIAIGVIIMGMGGLLISGQSFSGGICRVFRIRERGERVWDMVLFGTVMALLPCPSHLGVLAYIVAKSRAAWSGLIYGISFASGQAVSISILFVLAAILGQSIFKMGRYFTAFRVACGIILLILGVQHVVSILLGMQPGV